MRSRWVTAAGSPAKTSRSVQRELRSCSEASEPIDGVVEERVDVLCWDIGEQMERSIGGVSPP